MQSQTIQGIILSRNNYGEADRLITLYSRELGRIKVIAKGSRKLKSKMAAHIEPFSFGKYYLISGKTFYILAGADASNKNLILTENISLYRDASYVLETIKLISVENQNNPELFDFFNEILKELPLFHESKRQIILRYFEYNILRMSGYSPEFKKCKSCGIDLKEYDEYIGTFEGIKCSDCNPSGTKINKNTLKILRLFQTASISEILNISEIETFNEQLLGVISPYFYDILPRKPKSLNL